MGWDGVPIGFILGQGCLLKKKKVESKKKVPPANPRMNSNTFVFKSVGVCNPKGIICQ